MGHTTSHSWYDLTESNLPINERWCTGIFSISIAVTVLRISLQSLIISKVSHKLCKHNENECCRIVLALNYLIPCQLVYRLVNDTDIFQVKSVSFDKNPSPSRYFNLTTAPQMKVE